MTERDHYDYFLNYETIPEALSLYEDSDRPAILCAGESVSYRELIAQAKKLALAFKASGLGKGGRVMVTMDRGIPLVTAMLGILYAGASYVIANPDWPKERLEHIRRDSRAFALLDEKQFAALRAKAENMDLARETPGKFGGQPGELSGEDGSFCLPFLRGEDECAVYYTSGSTGQPKGCVLHHRTLYHFAMPLKQNMYARKIMEDCERCLCVLSFAFVASAFELFTVLLCGKTLLLATEEERRDPFLMGARIRSGRAQELLMTPSQALVALADEGFARSLRDIRCFALIGETPSRPLLRELEALQAGCVLQTFGTSETAMVAGCPISSRGSVPIGEPTYGARLYVLSPDGRQVSAGETGELCVGGVPAQYGYYADMPELTGQKYTEKEGLGRIFHTGDRARLYADGSICVLGRMDNMRKLHGQRIELEEVERALELFPGIRRAAADIRGEEPESALFAWYITDETLSPKAEERVLQTKTGASGSADGGSGASPGDEEKRILDFLRKKLPCYMIPKRLQEVAAFPLSRSGKLLRRKLPDIEAVRENDLPPETMEEELLCRLFEQILHLDRVGRRESFFALGGDSMLAMLLLTSLRKETGKSLSYSDLFQNPEPALLARLISKHKQTAEETQALSQAPPSGPAPGLSAQAPPSGPAPGLSAQTMPGIRPLPREIEELLEREGAEAVFPAELATLRFYFLEQMGVARNWKPRLKLRSELERSFSGEAIRERVEALTRRHPMLRSRFVMDRAGKLWQLFLRQKENPVWYRDLSHMDDRARENYISGFFNVMEEAGDAFQVACFPTGGDHCTLLLQIDHSLADGFSCARILNELASEGKEEPDRFYEYRKKRLCQGEDFPDELRAYYRGYEGSRGGRGRMLAEERSSVLRTILLNREQTEQLLRMCGRRNLTLASFVNYCYGQCLLSMTNRRELLLVYTFSGRDPAFEGSDVIIGNLVCPMPVRIRADMTYEEFGQGLMIPWKYPYITDTKEYRELFHYELDSGIVSRNYPPFHESVLSWTDFPDQTLRGHCLELREGRLMIMLSGMEEKRLDALRDMLSGMLTEAASQG